MDTPEIKAIEQGKYVSYGKELGTEILRYIHPDGSLSGIISKFHGGLITARHVVEAHNLPGFYTHQGSEIDLAYKIDTFCTGLPLGFVDKISFDGVSAVTSVLENPDQLITVAGEISTPLFATSFCIFYPSQLEDCQYFKPGASGSPLIYKEHIIGIVPFINKNNPYELPVIAFTSRTMRKLIEEFGLKLHEIK